MNSPPPCLSAWKGIGETCKICPAHRSWHGILYGATFVQVQILCVSFQTLCTVTLPQSAAIAASLVGYWQSYLCPWDGTNYIVMLVLVSCHYYHLPTCSVQYSAYRSCNYSVVSSPSFVALVACQKMQNEFLNLKNKVHTHDYYQLYFIENSTKFCEILPFIYQVYLGTHFLSKEPKQEVMHRTH